MFMLLRVLKELNFTTEKGFSFDFYRLVRWFSCFNCLLVILMMITLWNLSQF